MSDTRKAPFSATKILLPIDFSLSSEAALGAAAGLAQQFHAAIHLVHIIPEIPDSNGTGLFPQARMLGESRETIVQKLDAIRDQLMIQGVSASFGIEEGNDIVGVLMQVIERENTDLVVISTHGMSGWHPLIFGSIAEQVIKQVNCTLLLLRSSANQSVAAESAIAVWDDCFAPDVAASEQAGSAAPESDSLPENRLDRAAENPAERTEQQHDEAHSLLTK